MDRLTRQLVLSGVALVCLGSLPGAQDWSRFRGPNGSGVAAAKDLPTDLSEEGILWRTELPPGHSSPVLFGEHVFLTAIEDDRLFTLCLERERGEIVWRKEVPRERKEEFDNRNNPASPSPVVDADVVVVFFPEYGLRAYDHVGAELWSLELGPFNNVYGMGASPILFEDQVILACDQSTGSYLLSVGKLDGKERWRAARAEAKSSHCTPILYHPADGKPQLILPGSFFLDAYDLATGKKVWWASGLCFEMKSVPVMLDDLVFVNGYGSPMNQPGNQITVPAFEQVVAKNDKDEDGKISQEEMPASRATNWFDFVDLEADGLLDAKDWEYLQAALASTNGMLAFAAGGEGDVTEESLVWSYHRSVPQLPSPLIYQDVLYMLNDGGGLITTFQPATGEVIERGRIEEAVDNYYASPVAGDDKVYLVSLAGLVVVLPGGGSLEPITVQDLGEACYATPALDDGRVYLRTENALYCFGSAE